MGVCMLDSINCWVVILNTLSQNWVQHVTKK
jgi:hypothetical protein